MLRTLSSAATTTIISKKKVYTGTRSAVVSGKQPAAIHQDIPMPPVHLTFARHTNGRLLLNLSIVTAPRSHEKELGHRNIALPVYGRSGTGAGRKPCHGGSRAYSIWLVRPAYNIIEQYNHSLLTIQKRKSVPSPYRYKGLR